MLLRLRLQVRQVGSEDGQQPVANAQVDIWHCDADGMYSSVNDRVAYSCGQTFLRGYQMTDTRGRVDFKTIFPGWYRGRTVHIHCNVRIFDTAGNTVSEHQTQIFFRESLIRRIYSQWPYATRAAARDTTNATDFILSGTNARGLLFAQSVLQPRRIVASAILVIDTADAGHKASVSTSCSGVQAS